MKSKIFTTIILLLLIPIISASYISGDIYLNADGSARFKIETDTPLNNQDLTLYNEQIKGTTELFTTKQSGIWKFTLPQTNYNNIFIDIHLPQELQSIIEITGNENIIDFEKRIITIIDSDQLDFSVSYKLSNQRDLSFIPWLILLSILTIFFAIFYKYKKKKHYFSNVMPLVSNKEEKILNSLMKSQKRQSMLRKELNIPKASFTRYLINLEKKKLIAREGEGKNKVVKLK